MSEQKKTRPKVPDGHSQFMITRQKKPNEKGYVGYEVVWDKFHKEAEYQTPKQP